MRAPSPKDTKCKFCGRRFTARGVLEHQRHHCGKNPNRKPREFKKSRCKHCGKELHGNGLRVHVASVHPEAYARSRSVKAHRMKERRSGSAGGGARKESARAGSGAAERNALSPKHATRSRESPAAPRKEHGAARQHHQPETRAETTDRIWKEVRSRMPLRGAPEALPIQERKGSTGNWRHGDQEPS
jgi:hypothetical protein